MNTIYGAIDSQMRIRYVGATKHAPAARIASAYSHRYAQHANFELWLRTLEHPPGYVVLESHVPTLQRDEREAFWIAVLRQVEDPEYPLLNVATCGGGTRGAPVSAERRAAISARTRADHAAEQRITEAAIQHVCSCGRSSPTRRGLGIHKAKAHKEAM